MGKTLIYLVGGYYTHESECAIIRAFRQQLDAKTFAQKCQEYEESQPEPPYAGAPEQEWEQWRKDVITWRENHPAGYNSEYNDYSVVSVELN